MRTIVYHGDKSRLPPGPWQDEPDKVQWQDEETGLPCLVVRGPMGALCGYVGVPNGHPWHGRQFDEIEANVHGGLTYSSSCMKEMPEDVAICHVPDEGEPDDVWWLGFDCAHGWDIVPKWNWITSSDAAYRDLAYVQAEVRSLAKQAAEAAR